MMRRAVEFPKGNTIGPTMAAGMMGKTDKTPATEPMEPGAEQEAEGVDHAFDVWLRRGLHQLYDTVAREPIPEELLRLIEGDREEPKK